jgi:hypothetical protein
MSGDREEKRAMRINTRPAARVLAAVSAVGAIVGVPVAMARTVGVPLPTAEQWRMVWNDHQVDSGFVVRVGLTIVSLLWVWFVATALLEVMHVLAGPASDDDGEGVERPSGRPSHWIRRWVRFVAVSSVAATGSVVVIAGAGLGQREAPASIVTAEVTVRPATPAASAPSSSPLMADLAGLSLLSAGVVLGVQRLRRGRLRAAPRGARTAAASVEQIRFEVMMRSLTPVERVARLDHAIRMAMRDLAGSPASIAGARLAPDGTIGVRLSHVVEPSSARWLVDVDPYEWVLPPSVPIDGSFTAGPDPEGSCPLMVPLGVDLEGRECFVDVGAIGVLVVESPMSHTILRSMAASLAVSPFIDDGTVITVGLDSVPTAGRPIERVASLAVAVARAREVIDQPVVVVATRGRAPDDELEIDGPRWPVGRGRLFPFGVVTDSGPSTHRLVTAGDHHVLQPWGWSVVPPAVTPELLAVVQAALEEADRPMERLAPVLPIEPSVPVRFDEQEWHLLVRVLGQVEVVSADGVTVAFDRSKALELVVWLSLHRERPTRSKARAALWDTAVTAATFSNVVSDARRAMARVMPPPAEAEWIARTLTEEMSLHPLVVSDADVLTARVEAARRLPSFEAIEVLRPGLELVTGLPFESSYYAWPDAEGHTSALVLLATDAAADLAGHYLALGDIDGVFWATGKGLKVLGGHEELIALRMRAHAARGDRSGVRHEWESYERALAADTWSAADPSPKLVALRAELLSSGVWTTSSRAASA